MKKGISLLISLLFALVSLSALAAEPFTTFTSIEMAEEYCPPIYNLVFTPTNPSVVNGSGVIEGSLNPDSYFKNYTPNPAPAPLSLSSSGDIQDVTFRESDGIYGYISGTQVSCFYWYPMFTGTQTALIMQGKRTP
jgi:hypothetical protein